MNGWGAGVIGRRQRKRWEPLGLSEIIQRRVDALHKIGRKVKMA